VSADIFSALADSTRRSILEMLAGRGRMTATEISEKFPISAQAVSQHLKVLLQANLVFVEKKAQQRIYRLNPAAVDELEQWTHQLRERWSRRLDELDVVLKKARSTNEGEAGKNDHFHGEGERPRADHDAHL
jgi:DNA-binding transcriptional ArsR family regulator